MPKRQPRGNAYSQRPSFRPIVGLLLALLLAGGILLLPYLQLTASANQTYTGGTPAQQSFTAGLTLLSILLIMVVAFMVILAVGKGKQTDLPPGTPTAG